MTSSHPRPARPALPRRRPTLEEPIRLDSPPTGAGYGDLLRPPAAVRPGPGPGRSGSSGWARPLVGALLGLAVFLTVTPVVGQGVTVAGWLAAGRPGLFAEYGRAAAGFATPIGMLAANLAIVAVLVPVSALLVLVWHRRRPGWLASVEGRLRWRWLAVCLAVAVPVYAVLLFTTMDSTGPGLAFTGTAAGFVAVAVLTSPLQAAAEEVFFRGYLLQGLGSLAAGPWLGVVGSSLVFALLHGTQNLPLFLNRFAFGLLAGTLAWATGGLEAPIAAHAVNNVLAYSAAALTGTVGELRATTELGWPAALVGVAGYAGFTIAAVLAGRRRAARTVPAAGPVRP